MYRSFELYASVELLHLLCLHTHVTCIYVTCFGKKVDSRSFEIVIGPSKLLKDCYLFDLFIKTFSPRFKYLSNLYVYVFFNFYFRIR